MKDGMRNVVLEKYERMKNLIIFKWDNISAIDHRYVLLCLFYSGYFFLSLCSFTAYSSFSSSSISSLACIGFYSYAKYLAKSPLC